MQLVYLLVTFFALAIAIFAFQNAEPVQIRFLRWTFESSVAVVILGSAAVGAVIAVGLGLLGRMRRRPARPAPGQGPGAGRPAATA